MTIIKNIQQNLAMYHSKAFTLAESLLCLAVTTVTILLLSSSLAGVYESVERELFFISFEHFYRHCQKMSVLKQEESTLHFTAHRIKYGQRELVIPDHIRLLNQGTIPFNKTGGSHSLAKIEWQTPREKMTYQLNLGSGNYQKRRH